MKLKNMQITAEEQKERDDSMKVAYDAPGRSYSARYPYGLELRLDNEAMEKLSIDKMPAVGKRVRIEAVGVVTGAHINESRMGKEIKKNKSLEIQIQRLGVSADPQSAEDAVDDALEDL